MNSLFNISTFYYSTPDFYRIRQINDSEYHIEPKDRKLRSFTIKKLGKVWLAEGGYTEFQAAQIGDVIEKRYRGTRKD